MSGRAGRRGLDAVGHVFVYFQPGDGPLPSERDVREVLTGPVLTLKSAFRLTYSMILNILRVDELRVEDMMQQSFSEAAGELEVVSLVSTIAKADEQMSSLDDMVGDIMDEGDVRRYAASYVRICELSESLLKKLVMSQKSFEAAFAKGRLVILKSPDECILRLAVLLSSLSPGTKPRSTDTVRAFRLLSPADPMGVGGPMSQTVLIDPLGPQSSRGQASRGQIETNGWRFDIRDVSVRDVVWFGEACTPGLPRRGQAARLLVGPISSISAASGACQVASAFLDRVVRSTILTGTDVNGPDFAGNAETGGGPSVAYSDGSDGRNGSPAGLTLAPLHALARTEGANGYEETFSDWTERDELIAELVTPSPSSRAMARALQSSANKHKDRSRILKACCSREMLRGQIQRMRSAADTRRMPDLLPEYKQRVQVLQEMKYVGDDGVSVLVKGRHGACEVATVDCVVLTEIVLENVLNGLSAAEVASLLSSLVCRKKNKASTSASDVNEAESQSFSSEYNAAKSRMREIVRDFGAVQMNAGVKLEFEIGDAGQDYESAMCRWALAEVVLHWANGAPFSEVVQMTDLQEGDIVVTVKRLVEVLNDAKGVAKAVGNEELIVAIDEAIEAIRRDIIFSGSLYLT